MLKLKLGKVQYEAVFIYHREVNEKEPPTECLFYSLVDGNRELIANGIAKCYYTDTFHKVIGRKVAFAKAIKSINRNDRKKLWVQYQREIYV